ncbi:MAG TPA: hypothetical protein VKA21_02225 [Candidatus Binatia bacterium]|nr:hypothetical protein [Candidatus Binatia bacterium]
MATSRDVRPGTLLAAALLALVALGLVGWMLRSSLGMSASPGELASRVRALGWQGQALFLVLVTFRQFLAIPAGVILTVGGLCFGALLGTVLGGLGIVVSGLGKFGLARTIGRRWLGARLGRLEARAAGLGPAVIGISTAHPFGVLAPFHWAAGLSPVRFASFALALALGAPVRAFAYSVFGASLTDPGSPAFWATAAVLAALVVLPLLVPGVRSQLLAWRREA